MRVQNRKKSKYNLGGVGLGMNTGAPVQLTPAQIQAQKAEALHQQQINMQRNAAVTPTPDARGYGPQLAKYGGMKYGNGGLPMYGAKRKFAVGGSMYGDNTVQSAGQGATGSTSSIVYQENNPELQTQRQEALDNQTEEIKESGESLEQELEQDELQADQDIADVKIQSDAKFDQASGILGTASQSAKAAGLVDKAKNPSGIANAVNAYKTVKAAKSTMKGIKGFNDAKTAFDVGQRLKMGESAYKMSQMANNVKNLKIGTDGMKTGIQGFSGAKQGLDAVKTGAEITKMGKDGFLVGSQATQAAAGTSALGSAASALNNVNVYSAAANFGGKAISRAYDDGDATTWTAGEATGDVLGSAGEYAGYGAMAGSIIPGVGNVVGGVVGGIVGAGVGLYKGFTGRKKARKEEARAAAEKKKKVDTFNADLTKNFGSQMARVNSGKMKQKTYSGYDLGQNVVAKRGGYRNMPQYI